MRIHMHTGEGYAADGALYEPAGQAPFAAIILVPDESGLTQRVSDAASGLAASGNVVVAVDLNRGESPSTAKRSDEQTRHDLNAALAFLSSQTNVKKGCFGAVGWGDAVKYVFELAASSKVCAVAIDALPPPASASSGEALHAAVIGGLGSLDPDVTRRSVDSLNERVRLGGKRSEIKIYPQANRGFDDPADQSHFRTADADDFKRRMQEFFAAQLK
jgi:carboxymethylenebutenolidase